MSGLDYDFAGNLTSGGGMTLGYSPLGSLASVTGTGLNASSSTKDTSCSEKSCRP